MPFMLCILTNKLLLMLSSHYFVQADEELIYDHLASGLKASLQKDKYALDANRLQMYTGITLWSCCLYF